MGEVLVLERPPRPRRESHGVRGHLHAVSRHEPREADAGFRMSAAEGAFRSPGLALLAAVSILEGYRWLGVIPVDGSRLSLLVFGRVGAGVFAVLAAASAAGLTGGTRRRRSTNEWLVVAGASLVVMATCVLAAAASGEWARYGLGSADLALASASVASLIIAERGRRVEQRDVEPASPSEVSDHAASAA